MTGNPNSRPIPPRSFPSDTPNRGRPPTAIPSRRSALARFTRRTARYLDRERWLFPTLLAFLLAVLALL